MLVGMGYDYQANGPWVARHTGSGDYKTHPFSVWKFYDDGDITLCADYNKNCNTGESKYMMN